MLVPLWAYYTVWCFWEGSYEDCGSWEDDVPRISQTLCNTFTESGILASNEIFSDWLCESSSLWRTGHIDEHCTCTVFILYTGLLKDSCGNKLPVKLVWTNFVSLEDNIAIILACAFCPTVIWYLDLWHCQIQTVIWYLGLCHCQATVWYPDLYLC